MCVSYFIVLEDYSEKNEEKTTEHKVKGIHAAFKTLSEAAPRSSLRATQRMANQMCRSGSATLESMTEERSTREYGRKSVFLLFCKASIPSQTYSHGAKEFQP